MANTDLSHADNVNCLYAGQTMSLFMNLRREGDVMAACSGSAVGDLPVELDVFLQRLHSGPIGLPKRNLPVTSRLGDGIGGETLTIAAAEDNRLLNVTIDLSSFPERSRQLSLLDPEAAQHTLIDQCYDIGAVLNLTLRLRTTANAAWPLMPSMDENHNMSFSHRPSTPPPHMDEDVTEGSGMRYSVDESLTRRQSTSRSLASRTTRLFDPSEPRSQLDGPLFLDQTLFPIIQILFIPELFTKEVSTPPHLVWDMSVQVVVDRARERRARRAGKERESKRPTRRHQETVNLNVEESVMVSSSVWDDDILPPRQFEAIALSFNADHREPIPDDAVSTKSANVACDVARAMRLNVDDFNFEVVVTAKKRDDVSLEELLAAVRSYHQEHFDVAVLDIDLDDLMSYIYDRYAYMKMIPYCDGITFHSTVWEAVRQFLGMSVVEDDWIDNQDTGGAEFLDNMLSAG